MGYRETVDKNQDPSPPASHIYPTWSEYVPLYIINSTLQYTIITPKPPCIANTAHQSPYPLPPIHPSHD